MNKFHNYICIISKYWRLYYHYITLASNNYHNYICIVSKYWCFYYHYVIYITLHYIYNCICVILKLIKFLLSLYVYKIIIAFIIFKNTDVFTIILKSGKE